MVRPPRGHSLGHLAASLPDASTSLRCLNGCRLCPGPGPRRPSAGAAGVHSAPFAPVRVPRILAGRPGSSVSAVNLSVFRAADDRKRRSPPLPSGQTTQPLLHLTEDSGLRAAKVTGALARCAAPRAAGSASSSPAAETFLLQGNSVLGQVQIREAEIRGPGRVRSLSFGPSPGRPQGHWAAGSLDSGL